MPEELENPWCLTLPQDMIDTRDFRAEEAISIDKDVELPESFSLGEWIWETNYQGSLWSCTANSTSHWVQVLSVAKNWKKPTDSNIITPDWKDLWIKMWHNPNKYDGGDYVEKAVSTALKEWVLSLENGDVLTFDAYCTFNWDWTNKCIDTMKRYLYQINPIIWVMKWNKAVWNQLSAGQLKNWIKPSESTWAHAICLVGWDQNGFRFVNSRLKNDGKNPPHKSRFHVPYSTMKTYSGMFNFRMWILYTKLDAWKSPEYLKRKNNALIILKALRKMFDEEKNPVKSAIVKLSVALREEYPDLNDEFPVE